MVDDYEKEQEMWGLAQIARSAANLLKVIEHWRKADLGRAYIDEQEEAVVANFMETHQGHDIRALYDDSEFVLDRNGASQQLVSYKLRCNTCKQTSTAFSSKWLPPTISRPSKSER